MSKYDGRWEAQPHYADWGRYCMGEDFDPETEIEPTRLAICMFAGDRNLHTATACLLNLWDRSAHPEAWDEGEAWLRARGWPREDRGSSLQFEDDANDFLRDLGKRVGSRPKPASRLFFT